MKKVVFFLAVLCLAAGALAQEAEDDLVQITPQAGGWEIEQLFRTISEYTGQSIVFDPASPQIRGRKIEFVGTQTVPRSKLFEWFQSLLSFQRLVLVPVGPVNHVQWMALDLNAPQITNRPIFVAEDDLESFADRDGVYIVSTITVKNLTDTSRARNALAQLSTRQIGRINDVPGNLAFVVGDFAPVVASMNRLLRAMDKEPIEYNPVPMTYPLKEAVAAEVEPILLQLLATDDQARAARRTQQPGVPEKPGPQIIADTRQDAIIVYAVPEDQERIGDLIRLLDQEVVYKRGNIHIRPIKHTNATELASLLSELISGTGLGTSGSSRTPRQPGRPGTGPASAGQLTGQGDPVLVADDRSNSLLIQASATQLADLEDIIRQIDVPRDQVLVEAALVELSVDDLFRFGMELVSATTQRDPNERTFFGATQYGLSTLTDTDDDGIVDTNIPTINTGLIAGIYDNKRFPVLLQALQTEGRAQALSIPSVVVENGAQATMKVEDEVPYQIRSTDQSGNTNFSVEFTQAEISLDISPHISSDNYLRLHIVQKVQSFGTRSSENFPPPKTARELETDIVVPDGYTVVMGGLMDKKTTKSKSGIPYLRDIPILEYLFGTESETTSTTSLFLFVTPHILRQGDQGHFDDYHRQSWERKMLADRLIEQVIDIPNSRFRDKPLLPEGELERIQDSGFLDMPRYKSRPTPQMTADEARRRFDDLKTGNGEESQR